MEGKSMPTQSMIPGYGCWAKILRFSPKVLLIGLGHLHASMKPPAIFLC